MRSDCTISAQTGGSILLSIVMFRTWRVSKEDVQSAFIETGPAERPVYVFAAFENGEKMTFFWLFEAAAYDLVNTNAQSD